MAALALELVDMVDADGDFAFGLVPVHGDEKVDRVDEASVLHEARSFQQVDYIFFRRFSDGRSSQVAAFVVDNGEDKVDERSLSRLHHQVWLHGTAPLLYVAWRTRIDILSCARGPDFWVNDDTAYKPADRIKLPTAGYSRPHPPSTKRSPVASADSPPCGWRTVRSGMTPQTRRWLSMRKGRITS